MLTVPAFLLAIGVLVAVHECGHFAAARACGVGVLRFSIGLGPSLWSWTSKRTGTEFVIGCLPIGGYVKMLGEDASLLQSRVVDQASFSEQPWRNKAAIAVAGPLANLMLSVLLFAGLGWYGVEQAAPVLSAPFPQSRMAHIGLKGGERVIGIRLPGDELHAVASFDELQWKLAQFALDDRPVHLEYVNSPQSDIHRVELSLQGLASPMEGDGRRFYRELGLLAPQSPAVLGPLQEGGAALLAGLKEGDVVLQVDQIAIVDAAQLRDRIRHSVVGTEIHPQQWRVQRGQAILMMTVAPKVIEENGARIGRVGAVIGQKPETVLIRYGLAEGLQYGLERTWALCVVTWRAVASMVSGQGSLQQLSGPLTIADYAGKSAAMGWVPFIHLLALLSVSLGVLNLLPVPVLDGGHLLYYLWESLSGKPVPALWVDRLQAVGLALLGLMMSIAIFNDLARLLR